MSARSPALSLRRLFGVYVLLSLVPVAAFAVLLTVLMARQADARGLREGAAEATLVAGTGIAPLLRGADLRDGLRPDEVASVRASVALAVRSGLVLRLRLRSLDGHVVYSSDGSSANPADPDALAAARGATRVAVTHLDADSGNTHGPTVIEAYLPLRAAQSGRPIGVAEEYLPYAPVAADIGTGEAALGVGGTSGLVLTWLVLLGLCASTTRRLRRQARETDHMARHDTLTGLANRHEFGQRAADAIAVAEPGREVAIAIIDLDRFKDINDTLGHGSGDALLQALAVRLAGATRRHDLVARLGGDEFGLLIPDVSGVGPTVEILQRLRTAIAEPILLDGLPLAVEASIGFALAPADGRDLDQLIARADMAMYDAKRQHHGAVHWHTGHAVHDASTLAAVAELGEAIASDQLVLFYQPKADLRTGRILEVEALVRWQHPQRGMLPPDTFLPAAEQTELVEPMTRWVLRRALRDIGPMHDLAVAVNVSARSLTREGFADDVLAAVAQSGVAATRLIIEITETSLLNDPDRAARTLERLSAAGVRISIDDFGAGQTSLGYLARLPVSELKIDKAFVLAMENDQRNAAIVRSVVELGHSLDFRVTAEGVETPEALASLHSIGCDQAQGYLLSRPCPLNDLGPALEQALRILAGGALIG